MGLKLKLGLFLLLLGLLSASPVAADSPTVDDMSKEFICQCGCYMVLGNCSHGECTVRGEMMASIKRQIDAGRSKDEIIRSFVQQYGEQVLAAPPKQGFNLAAWILPFGALVIGGGIIYAIVRAGLITGRRPQADDEGETEEANEEYRRRLEKELKEFRG